MTIEYQPVGIACNLKCSYCYQDPMRDAGNINLPRNWERVKEQLLSYGSDFSVFGGEPLLTPIDHLEEVFAFGFEKFGMNGIQTNGVLITEAHIDLFRRFKVGVGISVDGPDDLNSPRSDVGDTNLVLAAIKRLCDVGMPPSLIITIHQENAGDGKLPRLLSWLNELEAIGIKYLNFHILELEKGKEHLALEERTNTKVFLELYEWSLHHPNVRVEPFCDIYSLLTEERPRVSCVWNHCDPATTAAVQGVSPDGSRSNCGRTNKDGVNWQKGDEPGFERYLVLHRTPQEVGGCKDCTFFIFCKGQCPGTAIGGDWRNRTRDCRVWYSLFERVEMEIIKEARLPISRDYQLKGRIEQSYLREWSGENAHHADVPHGDVPHGDSHGDSPHGDGHYDTNPSEPGGIPGVWLDEPPKLLNT